MSSTAGPDISENGLILYLDAANNKSIVSGSSNWTNLSENNISGSLIGNPVFSEVNNGSIVLNGSSTYIVSNTLSTFNVGCIAIWVNPSALINSATAGSTFIQLRYGVPANSAWYIGLGSITSLVSNEYITIADASDDRRTSVADGGNLAQNTWHCVVFNYNITTSQYKIFVNAVERGTVSSVAGNVSLLTNPNKLYIGAFDGDGGGPRSFFNGQVANFVIYNRALSVQEIQQNFNAQRSRFGV